MTDERKPKLPVVALVGRPNVGKSTLFNRLIDRRVAIVESLPGVTRDRIYADANWNGRDFIVVDTGGITDDRSEMARQISNQAMMAAAEADVILFLVDAREGLLPPDRDIAERLRRTGKPVLLMANKAENRESGAYEFSALGLGEAMLISAEHGLGVGEALDAIVAALPPVSLEKTGSGLALSVVGRPNVGKSSLVNALLGVERMITNDQPGTTRDAIDTTLRWDGRELVLIDTAGIRRAARIDEPVEYYAVLRAIKAVSRSDVVLLVLAVDDPVTAQDRRIAGIVLQAGKACLILVNKWDLKPDDLGRDELREKIRAAFDFLDFAPILFISARTGYGVDAIVPAALAAAAEYAKRIPTARLNEVLNEAILVHDPPSHKGRKLRLFYASQVHVKPPVIQIQVNDPALVHFSYQRYLENRFREAFGFKGAPLLLRFKRRSGRE